MLQPTESNKPGEPWMLLRSSSIILYLHGHDRVRVGGGNGNIFHTWEHCSDYIRWHSRLLGLGGPQRQTERCTGPCCSTDSLVCTWVKWFSSRKVFEEFEVRKSCEDSDQPLVWSHIKEPLGFLSKAISSIAENYLLFEKQLLASYETLKDNWVSNYGTASDHVVRTVHYELGINKPNKPWLNIRRKRSI